MALQQLNDKSSAFKIGAICKLYDRERRQWVEAEVINTFCDDIGEWVRVRWGQRIKDILSDDPDLRVQSVRNLLIPMDHIDEMRVIALEHPNIAPFLQRMRPQRVDDNESTESLVQSICHSLCL